MTKMLSVCYETDDKEDESAVLMVFDGKSPTIIKAFTGEEAVELYKKLVEDGDHK